MSPPTRRFDLFRFWPDWLPGGRRRAAEAPWSDTLSQRREEAGALEPAEASALQELRLALEAAEAASRAKSEFLSQLGHEIRTPMSGITGMAQLLAGTTLDSTQRGYLELMQRAAGSLVGLVDRLLDFSSLENGPVNLQPEPLDLRALLDDVLAGGWPRALDKQLLLECQLAPDLPRWVRADPVRLRQVVASLLDNALEFTTVGQVVLSARTDLEGLVIEVADTGVGIAPELQPTVFAPFVRGDISLARRQGGIGLGLAVAHALVRAMGGRITLDSVPGRGASFAVHLRLPLVDPAPVMPASEARRVAVISDGPASQQALADRLRHLGHEAVAALSWRELAFAPETLDAASPDDVLYDEPLDGWPPNAPMLAEPGRRTVLLLQRRPDATLGVPGVVRLVRPLTDPDLMRALDPARRAPMMAMASPNGVAAAPGSRGRVLLIEDHEISQVVARAFLEHPGYEVDVAADASQAMAALGARDFALLLMDCQMPGMDGYELTRRIRAGEVGHRAQRAPIIALTAHATSADRQRCLDAGMNDYLAKPVGPQQLGETLSRWLPPSRA
jgi:signal transduction histidine kinase/CheY-like chemotaxis protein